MTNTDPKRQGGRSTSTGGPNTALHVAAVVGHPKLKHFESWLLPSHGLRVTRQSWWPGHERDFDFYVDMVRVQPGEPVWRTVTSIWTCWCAPAVRSRCWTPTS